MKRKFQEIINTPAMVVPSMTTQEIHLTLLEASVEYVKNNLNLETLSELASKIKRFMGKRGEDNTQIDNILGNIADISSQGSTKEKKTVYINAMLLGSIEQISSTPLPII
ncbi:MAG TPA: hypothetical protein VLF20_06310 [Patescibacteria group bacterium]|nr:hypothetical protein [Patescibacteria group bacterium]